jgi:hypothetical protein
MAYVSQERKAKIVAAVKPILKKYGIKATFAVRNHSTISLNIKSGPIDFVENYIGTDTNKVAANKMSPDMIAYLRKTKRIDVNPYWFHEHFSGVAKKFLSEVMPAMKSADWYDRSDAMTDYFDTAYYVDINIGKYNKPYEVV